MCIRDRFVAALEMYPLIPVVSSVVTASVEVVVQVLLDPFAVIVIAAAAVKCQSTARNRKAVAGKYLGRIIGLPVMWEKHLESGVGFDR